MILGKVTVNTQQDTSASDPFHWDGPRKAFSPPISPTCLAELFWGMPYSHPRLPPAWQLYSGIGRCPLDRIPIRWAGRLGLCSGQRRCLGCTSCWQLLGTADSNASGMDLG